MEAIGSDGLEVMGLVRILFVLCRLVFLEVNITSTALGRLSSSSSSRAISEAVSVFCLLLFRGEADGIEVSGMLGLVISG